MKFCDEGEYIILSSFHVDHLDWIATDFELKIKYRSELDFDLISNGLCEIDSIRRFMMMIRVQKMCLTSGMLQSCLHNG
jgi:hypothetical protein